ncbi:MAG: hypothetical protein J0647_05475, partial [Campylobacteraceae bacterium]|nr:hypothetical protein [Campylobacteraceae bacterium]
MEKNKVIQIIIEAFEDTHEQTISQLVTKTSIPRRTAQRYIEELIQSNKLKAFGQGRSRYYQRVYHNDEVLTRLAVLKNNNHVGTLIFGNGSYSFVYEKSFENTLDGIQNDNNASSDLYPLFENLIPEHHRRDKLVQGTHDLGSVLIELNNAHGDFKFVPLHELFKAQSSVEKRPPWIDVKNKILGENAYPNLIDSTIKISDEILDDISSKEHSNLSGYQHKVDVENGEIVESRKNAGYILKPLDRTLINYFERDELNQKNYYPFLALNEHLFMSFAKNELKLDVPMSGILPAKHGD